MTIVPVTAGYGTEIFLCFYNEGVSMTVSGCSSVSVKSVFELESRSSRTSHKFDGPYQTSKNVYKDK